LLTALRLADRVIPRPWILGYELYLRDMRAARRGQANRLTAAAALLDFAHCSWPTVDDPVTVL
jgi:hypothetical protein